MSGTLLWWSCQSPVAHSCGLLNHSEECSNLTQNLMQICCSTHSVILNVMATQYTCSHNSIYHPHWLVQWSRHCSHTRIPAHCPWLPGYNGVVQTVLITLTTAGLFPEHLVLCCLVSWPASVPSLLSGFEIQLCHLLTLTFDKWTCQTFMHLSFLNCRQNDITWIRVRIKSEIAFWLVLCYLLLELQ